MDVGNNSSKELLMLSLSKFYKKKDNIQNILPIISGTHDKTSKMSLRLIDWFVTNFSKKQSTNIIRRDSSNNIYHFNVYLSYRAQLKAYSKQQFDPFRRRDRITFFYDRDQFVETTIGQLNFFRWILDNHILDYITTNLKTIENDMVNTHKGNDPDAKQKKRSELCMSFVKNMNKTEGVRVIAFN
jgi:hypothetical protein